MTPPSYTGCDVESLAHRQPRSRQGKLHSTAHSTREWRACCCGCARAVGGATAATSPWMRLKLTSPGQPVPPRLAAAAAAAAPVACRRGCTWSRPGGSTRGPAASAPSCCRGRDAAAASAAGIVAFLSCGVPPLLSPSLSLRLSEGAMSADGSASSPTDGCISAGGQCLLMRTLRKRSATRQMRLLRV